MNPDLHYILAQQRVADLQRDAEQARLATDAGTRRRDSRDLRPIVRALPSPTAHPSPEAWPDAQRAADQMLRSAVIDANGRVTPQRGQSRSWGAADLGERLLHRQLGAPESGLRFRRASV
jgi:hypothetical protein